MLQVIRNRGVAVYYASRVKCAFAKTAWACMLMVLAINGCSAGKPQAGQAEIIADHAYNVHRQELGHSAVTQLSYQVDIPYPERAVSANEVQSLTSHGWRQCSEFRNEWERFGDSTVKPPRLVHQYMMSFAKDAEYMVIAMRYLSAEPAPAQNVSKPDNGIQNVYVLHYDLSAAAVREQVGEIAKTCLEMSYLGKKDRHGKSGSD